MKKIIISVVLLLALLMCATSCGDEQGGNPPDTKTVYQTLSELASKNYGKVTVDVVTNTDGVKLSAEYVLTQSSVQYSIEQLNLLHADADVSALSPSYKSTVSGTAAVNGDEIVLNGENVTLPSYGELKGAFKFEESNLANVVNETGSFEASVVSPTAFYDAAVNVQNMKVTVEYSQTALNKIVITYQVANTSVTATYTFEA